MTHPDPTILAAFDALAERLARPERWIKGKLARTSRRGRETDPENEKAHCWCLQGAIYTLPFGTHIPITTAFIRILPIPPGDKNPITVWNDDPSRTHADVLALIGRARAAYVAGQGG